MRVSNPYFCPSSASIRVSPACLWPNRKFSPTSTIFAPSVRTRICSTNSAGVQPRDVHSERQDQHPFNPFGSHQLAALFAGRQQPGRSLRRDHRGRMRIERQHRRPNSPLSRRLHHFAEQMLMPRMHAVEISDRHPRRTELSRLCDAPSNTASHLNLQPVIRKMHILRQRRLGRLMRQIVADVREIRSPRLQFLHPLEAPLDGRMRRMRPMPQCIQKQNVQSLQFRLRLFGNIAVIGQIRRRTKPEPQDDRRFSMRQPDRSKLQAEELKRLAIQRMQSPASEPSIPSARR